MSVLRAAPGRPRAIDPALAATYRLLVENAVDAVFHADGGVLRWVSPAVTDVLGWDPEELLGASPVSFFHPDDAVAAVDLRDRAGGGGCTVRSNVRMRHKAGGYRWVELSMRPVAAAGPRGGAGGVVGMLRDITVQVEAEAARAEAEERYRTLAENANDIVVRVGIDERLEWVSPSITPELGWTPAEVVGWPSRELVHPDDAERLRIAGRAATPTQPARVEVRLRAIDGNHRWFAVRYRQLVDTAGAVVGFVGAARDVDAEVAQRDELATVAGHYRMLAENASDIVAVIDGARRITWVAPSVTRALGWTPGQLVGTVVTNLVHVADRLRVQASLRASGLDPQAFSLTGDTFRVRMRTAAGDHRWMSGRLHRLDGGGDGDAAGTVLVSLVDVTDLVQAREAAQAERARARAVLDAAIDPHVTLDAVRDPASGVIVDFVYSDANPAAVDYLQTTYGELVGTPLAGALPGVDTTGLLARYAEVVETGHPLALDDFVYPYHELFGDERRYDIRATRVGDGISLTWRDVTRRFLEADAIARSEEKFRLLADNSSDVVVHLRAGLVVWVSPSLASDLGWSPEDWQDRVLADFIHPDDLDEVRRRRDIVQTGVVQVFRCRMQAADLTFHWVEIHAKPYYDRTGAQDGIVASLRTVDTEVRHEAELVHRAGHDELTGLLNRTSLLDRLAVVTGAGAGAGAGGGGRSSALVFCDVDHFKEINDTHGHLAGDEALRAVAARIGGVVRRGDVGARLGGDELVVLLDGVDDIADARRVAEKIRRAAARPIPVAGGEIRVTLSIGVALVQHGESVEALVGRADEAMYRAKQAGRDQVVTIDVADTARVVREPRATCSSPGPDQPIEYG